MCDKKIRLVCTHFWLPGILHQHANRNLISGFAKSWDATHDHKNLHFVFMQTKIWVDRRKCGCLHAFGSLESDFIGFLGWLCKSVSFLALGCLESDKSSITDAASILLLLVSLFRSAQEVSVSLASFRVANFRTSSPFFFFRHITKHLECLLSADGRDWSFKWLVDGFFLFRPIIDGRLAVAIEAQFLIERGENKKTSQWGPLKKKLSVNFLLSHRRHLIGENKSIG